MANQKQFDETTSALLEMAISLLTENGQLQPFGAVVTKAGELRYQGFSDDDSKTSREFLIFAANSLRALAMQQGHVLIGICCEVTIQTKDGQKLDALKLFLESPERKSTMIATYEKENKADIEITGLGELQNDPGLDGV